MSSQKVGIAVVKDRGGLAVLKEAVDRLRKEPGIIIHWLAEGLAAEDLLGAGETIIGGKPTAGFFDPKTMCRSDIDILGTFDSLEPGFLIASEGVPNNLEGAAVRAAVRRNIPTVVVSDIHGSGLRAGLEKDTPNLDRVLFTTLDSEDTRLVRGHFSGTTVPQIVETGSPAFDKFNSKVSTSRYIARITSPFSHHFFILGQDDCTGDFLEGTLKVAEELGYSIATVGLHPKFLAVPELCNAWLRIVKRSKIPVIWANGVATTHEYMASSTHVVTGYSTGIIEAGLIQNELGPLPISWASSLVRQRMSEALCGLTTFPTVAYGGAIEVTSAEDFKTKVPAPGTAGFRDFREQAREALRTRLHVDGKSAERIVDAIRNHAGI